VTRDKGACWLPEEIVPVVDEVLAEAPKAQKVWGT